LALLNDPSHVRANLSGQRLDRYLDHYLTAWAQPPDLPVADATPPNSGAANPASGPSAMNAPGTPGPKKVVVNIDFPTADSIPPISIMNPEPKGPVVPGAAAAAAAAGADKNLAPAAAAATGKKSRKQANNAPAPPAAPPPAEAAPVDPVWGPGTAALAPQPAAPAAKPQAPQQAAAPASPAGATIAPATAAPVQLIPSAPQPQASAGGTPHAQ
jgi:hypothetical protein